MNCRVPELVMSRRCTGRSFVHRSTHRKSQFTCKYIFVERVMVFADVVPAACTQGPLLPCNSKR